MRCLIAVVALSVAATAAAQSSFARTISLTSSRAILAVARGLTEATWGPVLDKRIQDAPTAAGLGAAWSPSDARWKKARASLADRVARVVDAYTQSGHVDGFIEAEVARMDSSAGLDRAIAALQAPTGPAIVRQQAKQAYIVERSAANRSPAIGSPEWNAMLRDLGKEFDDRIAPTLPPDDGSHVADLMKLAASPEWSALSRVFSFGVTNATRELNAALNLMMFDDRDAIERDIAAAIGKDVSAAPKPAASIVDFERLAACQDSWLEWKDDPVRANAYVDRFRTAFRQAEGGAFTPIAKLSAAGLPVTHVYPESVGTGVGFSILFDAPFERTKKAFEQVLGRALTRCESSEGTRTCSLEIGEKKTFVMIADASGQSGTTLAGCFYLYEK